MLGKLLKNLDLALASVIFAILVLVTFLSVIMRYFISSPITWTEEVQLACFLWLTFLGAGAAFRSGSHVAVEIIYERLPVKGRQILTVVNWILGIFFLGYMVFLSFHLISMLLTTDRSTYILHIPFWFIQAVVPAGGILSILCMSFASWRDFRSLRSCANKGKEA